MRRRGRSMSDLFRKEVASRQASRLEGEIRLEIAPGFAVATLLLGLGLIASLITISLSSYAKKATASGVVLPSSGLTVIRAPGAGQVQNLMFAQGDRVPAGQALLVLGQKRFLPQGEDTEQGMIQALQSRVERIDASMRGERSRNLSEMEALRERLVILDQRARTSAQKIALLRERSSNQEALIAKYEELIDDRYVSEAALVQQRDSLLSLKEELITHQLASHQLAEERVDVLQRLRDAPLLYATNSERLQQQRDQLSDSLLDVKLRSAMQIRSPIEGTVSAVLAVETDYVEQGQPLVHMYSNDSDLEAVLYAPSASIGTVAVGQTVNVRFAAFPHEKYGFARGTVTGISRSVLREEDRPEIEGVTGPAYQVKVRLPERDVSLNGRRYPLRPGMIVKAEIEVDRRTLIEWLFAPFRRLGSAG